MIVSFEVAFYKWNISGTNFTNYHHMFESNFQRINLRKLCEKAILRLFFLEKKATRKENFLLVK